MMAVQFSARNAPQEPSGLQRLVTRNLGHSSEPLSAFLYMKIEISANIHLGAWDYTSFFSRVKDDNIKKGPK